MSTDKNNKAALPNWVNSSDDPKHPLWECDDDLQMQFAVACTLHGFDLPHFDRWLANLADGPQKKELLKRRQLAEGAIRDHREEAALRHLEFMMMDQYRTGQVGFLLPLAQRDAKVDRSGGGQGRKGFEGKLKRTIRALFKSMEPCDLKHLMAELEADAQGRESALTELRERGRVFIKPLAVTADGMVYDELGGKSHKPVSAKRLNSILSELRKE